MVHVWQVLYHCVGWCDRFLGNGQFLQIYLVKPGWGLLLYWGMVSWGVEGLVWLSYLQLWVSSAAQTFSSGGWLHSWPQLCQVWHMMGVLGLLVPVCLLCTIRSLDGLQHISFGSPIYCCIQCSKLGYFGFVVNCQVCHGWLVLLVNHQQYMSGCLGNSLVNVHSDMTPPAPVSTLHLRVANWLGPISAGTWTVAKASAVESIQTSDISTVSGSASLLCLVVNHSLWGGVCRTTAIWGGVCQTTAIKPTSSQWGSSSVPPSLNFLCLPPLLCLLPLLWCLGPLSLGLFGPL